jgi:hypothetical protein
LELPLLSFKKLDFSRFTANSIHIYSQVKTRKNKYFCTGFIPDFDFLYRILKHLINGKDSI